MNSKIAITDQIVQESIIEPIGGAGKFRLVICPGFKLIQYAGEDGDYLDLILEDDALTNATVSLLEKLCVPEIPREAR